MLPRGPCGATTTMSLYSRGDCEQTHIGFLPPYSRNNCFFHTGLCVVRLTQYRSPSGPTVYTLSPSTAGTDRLPSWLNLPAAE